MLYVAYALLLLSCAICTSWIRFGGAVTPVSLQIEWHRRIAGLVIFTFAALAIGVLSVLS